MDVHRLKASDLEAAFRQIVQNIIWNKYKLAAVQCNGIAGLLELDEFLNTRANTLKVHDLWLIALGLANGSVYSEASVLEQLEKIVSSWDILRPIPLVTLTRA